MRKLARNLLIPAVLLAAAVFVYLDKRPRASPSADDGVSPQIQAQYAPSLQLVTLLFFECVRGERPRSCLPLVATEEMQRKLDDVTLAKFREGMESVYGTRGESAMVGKLMVGEAADASALFQFMLRASYEKAPVVYEDFAVVRDVAGNFRIDDLKMAVPKE